ncbi:MAG TPA: GH36 C-terminal domain-containing protein, partial [Chthonomonadales bacterium]|nr:GH36 C-terminal domain-containing protein [Chthonomonadales bacterium]
YDPVSNRRAFYDASYALPAAACECYVAYNPGPSQSSFVSMLRSGMMGWCTIMSDPSTWSGAQRAAAAREFKIFKSRLRPLIQSANLYHISQRPDGVNWDGMEYADTSRSHGVVYAFRGTGPARSHTFVLRGLDPDAQYRVECQDGSAPAATVSGADLMQEGLTVTLAQPQTSELVWLDRQ